MLVSDATLPSADRLLTHRLLERVLPHPLARPRVAESSDESDETDDATVVEHIEDGGLANLEQSNSCSSSAAGHIFFNMDGFVGKDSGGGGRMQSLVEEEEQPINSCS
jgi:hypothetical protein